MKKQWVSLDKKIFFCLHLTYLDTGFAKLNYLKFFLYAYAGAEIIATENFQNAWFAGIGFLIFCYLLGLIWWKTDMQKAQNEVSNRYGNIFIKEMRDKFKIKTSKQ